MTDSRKAELLAPCGIWCGGCSLYLVKDRPELMSILLQHGVREEDLPCPGCRAVEGKCKHIRKRCEQFACAKAKGVSFCYECDEFPCKRLHPAADRAGSLPHNLKMYALCYIKRYGPIAYIDHLPEMRRRYFNGKVCYGKGPQLPEDQELCN